MLATFCSLPVVSSFSYDHYQSILLTGATCFRTWVCINSAVLSFETLSPEAKRNSSAFKRRELCVKPLDTANAVRKAKGFE